MGRATYEEAYEARQKAVADMSLPTPPCHHNLPHDFQDLGEDCRGERVYFCTGCGMERHVSFASLGQP